MASSKKTAAGFTRCTIADLKIDDEKAFAQIALYAELKACLRLDKYPFRIMPKSNVARNDRALLLNLTYWGTDGGGDIFVDRTIAADVVAHVAWHHLAARALPARHRSGAPSVASLFFGEAIASAFDLYLVGRLLGRVKKSSFLDSQVPAMADAADAAGLSSKGFAALLGSFAAQPERSFEELRALLFDACMALFAAQSAEAGLAALASFEHHRLAPLLHHYELANWVLYARAFGDASVDPRVKKLDASLRAAPNSLAVLADAWLAPVMARMTR